MKKLAVLVIVLVAIQYRGTIAAWFNPVELSELRPGYDVVLFATSWCGYCAKTRKLLADNGVDYFEYDIEKSAEGNEKFRLLNGRGVPLLVVGDEVIRGFRPVVIERALDALQREVPGHGSSVVWDKRG